MNRITINMDDKGFISRICADEPLEIFIVSPHVPYDRVYQYGSAQFGPQYVREEIGGFAVGHINDGTLGGDESHKPPSKPTLGVVK